MDRVVASFWPAILAAVLLIGVHAGTGNIWGVEGGRIAVGLVVFLALVWSMFGILSGFRPAWPHLRFWAATGLGPSRYVRLVLFDWIREQHDMVQGATGSSGFAGAKLEAALLSAQQRSGLTSDRAALTMAAHLALLLSATF